MSGATGDFAAGGVTPPPHGKNSGHLNRHPGAPGGARSGVQDFFTTVSPSSYMSNAWSSPGAHAVEPSPEQHASCRQPIDMRSIPNMLLSCTRSQLPDRIQALHPGGTPELQRYRKDMEDAVILLRRNRAGRKAERPGTRGPKRIQALHSGTKRGKRKKALPGPGAPKRIRVAKGRSERYDKVHLMKLGSWNAQGFAKKTLAQIDALGLAGCAFQETHGNANALAKALERELGPHRWIPSKQRDGKPAPDPEDKGGECGIYLGKSLARAWHASGSPCPRLCWVQLRVQKLPVFVWINGYAPQAGLPMEQFVEYLEDLQKLVEGFPANTKFLYTADANCQLQQNIPGITGQYSNRKFPHDRGSLLIAVLRVLGWYTHSTGNKAKPTKTGTVATYCTGKTNANWYSGYTKGKKRKTPGSKHELTLKQLDYVMGSRELPIHNIRVHWDPPVEKYGRHYDHAMLVTTLLLKKSRFQPQRKRNFGSMLKADGPELQRYRDEVKTRLEQLRTENPDSRKLLSARYAMTGGEQNALIELRELAEAGLLPEAESIRIMAETEGLQKELDTIYQSIIEVAGRAYDVAYPPSKTAKGNDSVKPVRRWPLSEHTLKLIANRKKQMKRNPNLRHDKPAIKAIRNEINRSCRADWKKWLDGILEQMAEAEKSGDINAVKDLLHLLGKMRKKGGGNVQPTKNNKGKQMTSVHEEAEQWAQFLVKLFSEDDIEQNRTSWAVFPQGSRGDKEYFNLERYDIAFAALRKNRATGYDEIELEAYAASPELKQELYTLTHALFMTELTPTNFNLIVQVMLYKGSNKPVENRKSFRPLSMINHARKLISMLVLMDLIDETELFMLETAAGFRKGRGPMDALTILLLTIDLMINLGQEMLVVFLDLAGAFDTCSWRALDKALEKAKASVKSRAMFRTLYRTAKGTARVRKQSSTQETADSDHYDIRKSVLQGDVLSPWLFCLLMCYVLKIADDGRQDMAHPAEAQTGEEQKECEACETQWYVRCRNQNEGMCKPCRTIRRETRHNFPLESSESDTESEDECDYTSMMLPSSECADDIWLAGRNVAEVEARVRAIKEKGYRLAGFRLQGVKCESVIMQKEMAAEKTVIADVADNEHMCNVCGKMFGQESSKDGHERMCKKGRKRRLEADANTDVNPEEADGEYKVVGFSRYRGPPIYSVQAEPLGFWQMIWGGTAAHPENWEKEDAGDGTADSFWIRQSDISNMLNFSTLVAAFINQNKHINPNKSVAPPGEFRCSNCNELHFVDAQDLTAHKETDCLHKHTVRAGTLDDLRVKETKRAKLLADLPHITVPSDTKPGQFDRMEHVLQYKNLGKIVHYTGSSEPDIKNRIHEMNIEYFRLTVMWSNEHADLEHKLKLFRHYKAIMDYGSELWKLTAGKDGTEAIIRGWQGSRLAPIMRGIPTDNYSIVEGKLVAAPATEAQLEEFPTGVHQQRARPAIDCVAGIKARQHKFLGQKLRLPKHRQVRAHIMRHAYAVLRGVIPQQDAEAGLLRSVAGRYQSTKELAKMAGSEPEHAELDKWTVEQRAEAEDLREAWEKQGEEITFNGGFVDLDKRLRQERADEATADASFETEARKQEAANREPTGAEQTRHTEEEQQKNEKLAQLAELTRQQLSAVLQAHAIVLVMATDGGAIAGVETTGRNTAGESQGELDTHGSDPTQAEADKAGWGLTAGRFRGTVGLLSEGTYDIVIEQFGAVELDRQSEYFMGSRKKTNHTGELEALGHGMLVLLDRWEPHVAIMYDAKGDAEAVQKDSAGTGTNSALISTVIRLRKMVEANGTVLHWIKVKGHSKDKMNDRADYLATTGMHGIWDRGPLGRIDSDGVIGTPADRQAHKRKPVVDAALTKLRTAGVDIDNRD